jgi:hypothetical protein
LWHADIRSFIIQYSTSSIRLTNLYTIHMLFIKPKGIFKLSTFFLLVVNEFVCSNVLSIW